MISLKDTILITGGGGFLGSAVVRNLQSLGFENLVIPRRRDFDLTQQADVAAVYKSYKPDVVIHLAAEVGGIGANQDNPGRFFYANLAMGMHLIEFARKHAVKKFVQAGTICAYPKFTPIPFREEELWNGFPEETNAPYGIAKKALLTMCQAYREQYELDAVYLLPVNLYGPGDNFHARSSHVIPALIRKCVEARKASADHVTAWGTGSASREFLYVDDCADAFVSAMLRYDLPEPLNLGSGREITIRDLTELVARLSGFEGRIEWDPTKPDGQPRRCLDVSRAKAAMDWAAKTSLEDGLRKTIAFFEAHADAPPERVY